jgi:hypothetical protein
VPEAHQALVAGLDPVEELRDVLDLADSLEHSQRRLVGAPVQRTVERSDPAGHRRVGIDLG